MKRMLIKTINKIMDFVIESNSYIIPVREIIKDRKSGRRTK